jgi:hypothetical protein
MWFSPDSGLSEQISTDSQLIGSGFAARHRAMFVFDCCRLVQRLWPSLQTQPVSAIPAPHRPLISDWHNSGAVGFRKQVIPGTLFWVTNSAANDGG